MRLFSEDRAFADLDSFPQGPQASPRVHRPVAETLKVEMWRKGQETVPEAECFSPLGKLWGRSALLSSYSSAKNSPGASEPQAL